MRVAALLLSLWPTALSLSSLPAPLPLCGEWAGAREALRSTDCCVVSVGGLEPHLGVLRARWATVPEELDLRARVRTRSADDATPHADCLRVATAIAPDDDERRSCAAVLEALARGFASLAATASARPPDVFLRVVCASDYRARAPQYHTDKAPMRGYVTLRGRGTEYLRTPRADPERVVRRAEELEFIVMKGDHYRPPPPDATAAPSAPPSWLAVALGGSRRHDACVHRSPPAAAGEARQRRVIISFDLAAGEDDREWHVTTQRQWRTGFTQRKSPLPVLGGYGH